MTASRVNWRSPEHGSIARSSCLGSKAPYGDTYRPSIYGGNKRFRGDEGTSVAASRYSYATRNTARTSSRQHRFPGESVLKQDSFDPGTIILAEHLEELYDNGNTAADDKYIVRVPGGRDISKKPRLFITLASYGMHYTCLPIYSHNGHGTKYKPRPDEYITIRDHRAAVEAPPQSTHHPLVTKDMSGTELMAASVVHLAYPVPRSFSTPVKVIGRLSGSSISRMIQLHKTFTPPEYCETSSDHGTHLTIHAAVSVRDALSNLGLDMYALLFRTLSWDRAAWLSDKEMEVMGITRASTRIKLCSLFEKVEKASRSGPGWNIRINKDTLAVA